MRFQWIRPQAATSFGATDVGNGRLQCPIQGGLFVLHKWSVKVTGLQFSVAGGILLISLIECNSITGVFIPNGEWLFAALNTLTTNPGADTDVEFDFGDEGLPLPGSHVFCVKMNAPGSAGFVVSTIEFSFRMDYNAAITPYFVS